MSADRGRGIGGVRYCMLCDRRGDHNTADCPQRLPAPTADRGPKQLPVMRRPAPKARP